MSFETTRFIPPEAVQRKEVLAVCGPITANELLGTPVKEGRRLALGNAPIHVIAKTEQDGSRNIAAIVDYKLSYDPFISFLRTVAPYKISENAYEEFLVNAVVEDWHYGYSTPHLEKMHNVRLKDDWREFEKHHRLFANVLSDDRVQTAIGAKFSDISYTSYRHMYDVRLRDPIPTLGMNLVDPRDNSAFTDTFTDFLKENNVGPEIMQAINLENFQQHWAIAKKTKQSINHLLRDFVTSLNPVDQRRFIGETCRMWFIEPDDPPGMTYLDEYGVRITSLGNGRVDIRAYDTIKAEGALEDGEVKQTAIYSQNYLLPVIRWKVDQSGNRAWNFAFPTDEEYDLINEAVDINKDLPPDFKLDPKRLNPIVGILAAAYFTPIVCRTWEAEESLVPGGKKQDMGPAQVPVQALSHKDDIMQSDILPALEIFSGVAA